MDIDKPRADGESLNPDAKVVIVQNLTRNVVEAHLQTIFSFYGPINKIDLPVYAKSGQNRGKAAIEFLEPAYAHKAYTHMNGGQLDGAVLKLELSDLPVRSRSPHPPPAARRPPRRRSFSRSRSRSPLRRGARGARFGRAPPPPPPRARDSYRPALGRRRYTSRSYSRSRSPAPLAELLARGNGSRAWTDALAEHRALVAFALVLILAEPQPVAEQELLALVQLLSQPEPRARSEL
ncbi:hypothetical protein HDZ31DRAFT_65988 [Schizophyllum fasciatum]